MKYTASILTLVPSKHCQGFEMMNKNCVDRLAKVLFLAGLTNDEWSTLNKTCSNVTNESSLEDIATLLIKITPSYVVQEKPTVHQVWSLIISTFCIQNAMGLSRRFQQWPITYICLFQVGFPLLWPWLIHYTGLSQSKMNGTGLNLHLDCRHISSHGMAKIFADWVSHSPELWAMLGYQWNQ